MYSSTGTGWKEEQDGEFHWNNDILIGSYTLLAYDETDMEGSGHEMAAVQRTVEITGVTLIPTTSDGTTSATGESFNIASHML